MLTKIPNTDIGVSSICLGTMTFGNPVNEQDAINMIHWSLDHGINFIDTADMYEGYDRFPGSPGGVGESILGKALVGRRDHAVITTKVGNSVGNEAYQGKGLSPAHIYNQIDESLGRLQTDFVDFYELHRPEPDTPLQDSISAMVKLIELGKIRHWGFSNYPASEIETMLSICDSQGWPRPVISQPPLSWLKRDQLTDSVALCASNEIAVTPYQPLQGGLLTGKYQRGSALPADSRAAESKWLDDPDNEMHTRLDAFMEEAVERGLSPARYAIEWLLTQPGITSVVVGAKRIDQINEVAGL